MEKLQKPGFKLVGLKLGHKTTNENGQSSVDCGNLWQKFENDKIFDLVPNKLGSEVFAVYFDYDQDETKPFSYFIGCKVRQNEAVPENLDSVEIPPQTYQKFTAKGVMTGCITEAWKKIWGFQMDRTFGYDFEVYDERSIDWNNAEVDIYVSVKS